MCSLVCEEEEEEEVETVWVFPGENHVYGFRCKSVLSIVTVVAHTGTEVFVTGHVCFAPPLVAPTLISLGLGLSPRPPPGSP